MKENHDPESYRFFSCERDRIDIFETHGLVRKRRVAAHCRPFIHFCPSSRFLLPTFSALRFDGHGHPLPCSIGYHRLHDQSHVTQSYSMHGNFQDHGKNTSELT